MHEAQKDQLIEKKLNEITKLYIPACYYGTQNYYP